VGKKDTIVKEMGPQLQIKRIRFAAIAKAYNRESLRVIGKIEDQ